ncbi:hypothetical protein MTO96_025171 [Rhipicephalus appendiculatus]
MRRITEEFIIPESLDSSYELSTDDSAGSSTSALGDTADTSSPLEEPKCIVFKSRLLELFSKCSVCLRQTSIKTQVNGTALEVITLCPNLHQFVWCSQPKIGQYAAGNVLLAAGILFSGLNAAKSLRLLSSMKVATITERTFFRHQQNLLIPSVQKCVVESAQAAPVLNRSTPPPPTLSKSYPQAPIQELVPNRRHRYSMC